MNELFQSASRLSFSMVGNVLLGGIAAGVSACGLGLAALYLIEYVEETPSMKSLQCFAGIERPDCPKYGERMNALKAELDAIAEERNRIKGQLAGLRAVETAVDEITLFETQREPRSGLEITVGTVYKEFTNARPAPASFFCYINLKNGIAGESRNLHFRGRTGALPLSAATLEQAGVDAETLAFGQSVCKPFVIGQE